MLRDTGASLLIIIGLYLRVGFGLEGQRQYHLGLQARVQTCVDVWFLGDKEQQHTLRSCFLSLGSASVTCALAHGKVPWVA